MEYPLVTIVVVPRERFSHNALSLESIYKNTLSLFKLIYVDSHSPPRVKRYLEAQAAEKNFRLIRTNQFLTPNQARNLGQAKVDTKYVAFIDNDLMVAPNWLDKLVECAEATDAWVVGPLYLEDNLEDGVVHMAGGEAHFKQENGRRSFHGAHKFSRLKLSEIWPQLKREPTETIEFHCALARNDIFATLGPLDEKFMSVSEHQDFCLTVHAAGGSVYLEPDALVSYFISSPLAWADLPYFFERWSEARNQSTVRHMREKWNLPADDYFINLMLKFSKKHRMKFIRLWFPWQLHRLGRIISYPFVFIIDSLLSVAFTRSSANSDRR
jgi:GT2 family glycosyltransferase